MALVAERTYATAVAFALAALPAAAQEATVRTGLGDGAVVEASAETRFYVFEAEDGRESGVQIVTPLSLVLITDRFDLGIKTAHIHSERDSDFAGGSGKVSTLSDTVVSGSFRAFAGSVPLFGGRRVTLSFNADMNLPTGKEQLTGAEKNAVFDPFLVEQDRFGEGFNLGFGFGATLALTERTLVGVGASVIHKGDYSPDGDAPNRVLDPGDQVVGTFQLLHQAERWQAAFNYRIVGETITEVDGLDVFDRGVSHELTGTLAVALAPAWTARAQGLWATRARDRFQDPFTGRLATPTRDNSGDLLFGSLELAWAFRERQTLTALANVLHRAENAFDEVDFSFEPERTRYTAGLRYEGRFGEATAVSVEGAYYTVSEGDILGFRAPRFDGFKGHVRVSHAF